MWGNVTPWVTAETCFEEIRAMRLLEVDESSLLPVDRGNTPLLRAQIRAVKIAEVFWL